MGLAWIDWQMPAASRALCQERLSGTLFGCRLAMAFSFLGLCNLEQSPRTGGDEIYNQGQGSVAVLAYGGRGTLFPARSIRLPAHPLA